MPTLVDFVVQFFTSAADLFVVSVTDVALRDPLAFVSFLVGLLLFAFSFGLFGYLTLGAVGSLFSSDGTLGRRPPQRGR